MSHLSDSHLSVSPDSGLTERWRRAHRSSFQEREEEMEEDREEMGGEVEESGGERGGV